MSAKAEEAALEVTNAVAAPESGDAEDIDEEGH